MSIWAKFHNDLISFIYVSITEKWLAGFSASFSFQYFTYIISQKSKNYTKKYFKCICFSHSEVPTLCWCILFDSRALFEKMIFFAARGRCFPLWAGWEAQMLPQCYATTQLPAKEYPHKQMVKKTKVISWGKKL